MRVLAIDSSSLVAAIAVVDEEKTIAEYNIDYKKTHSQTLLPMLNEVATMMQLDWQDLDGIAVSAGPGSFTGLRIGAATAKGLALATGKPLIPIPTLAGMAYNFFGAAGLVCPLMDARRRQVYTGIYRVKDRLQTELDQSALDIQELIRQLNHRGEPVILLGDGVPVFREVLAEQLMVPFQLAPPHLNRQRGAAYGALGLELLKAGRIVSGADFRLDYLRESQAERERKARLQQEAGAGRS